MQNNYAKYLPAFFSVLLWSSSALAEDLEGAKKAFDKLLVHYCESDFIQAQAKKLDTQSTEYKEMVEKWYSMKDQLDARTQEENRAYKTAVGRLTKEEAAQFMQYSSERRNQCRQNPKVAQ